MIYSKFSGYVAGRRLYFEGGGAGGGDASGMSTGAIGMDSGITDSGPGFGDASGASIGSIGMDSGSFSDAGMDAGSGGSDLGYNPWSYTNQNSALPNTPAYSSTPAYTPQFQGQPQGQANTDIYRPTYTDYGPGQAYAISNYGQGITSPFGAFVNPFPQGGSQGIAGLYNHPEYADYGISGLTR
jgi:hypothetical protein